MPKRRGGYRQIATPYWPLMNIQRKILALLEEIYRPSSRVMGFVKHRGIKKNAIAHVGKRLILNIDIKEYFDSIHFGRIRGRLMAPPYNLTDDISTTIAKLCTLDGKLPTGSPSSPTIANIVTSKLDADLTEIGRRYGCFYTRYADDITFSTNRRRFPSAIARVDSYNNLSDLSEELLKIFEDNGFEVNTGKSRLLKKDDSQEVCGIICNDRLNVRREIRREIRGTIHAWSKHGKVAAEQVWKQKHNWRSASSLERSLRGKIEFLIHIRGPNDPSVAAIVQRFNSLPNRDFKDLEYDGGIDWLTRVQSPVCLVLCENEEIVEYAQGSGFVIPGGKILTNYHTLHYHGIVFPIIRISFPQRGNVEYDMKIVHFDVARDIAILEPIDEEWKKYLDIFAAELNFSEVYSGEAVTLSGFPNYHEGSSCVVQPGSLIGQTVVNGSRYFRISQMIVKGNSGGPVFNEAGQVVGIATLGIDAEDVANVTFNGCIALHRIEQSIL